MRVIVEVASGPALGKKVLLMLGQTLKVGRTEWADFPVPHDARMSGVHFALDADAAGCCLRDLGSTNGTQLNGAPVTERVPLHSGDKIQAGETIFSVDIEGDAPRQAAPVAAGPRAAAMFSSDGAVAAASATSAPAVLPQTPARPRASYAVERCISELTLCCGDTAEIQPVDLAVLLSQTVRLHVIVDLNKLDEAPRSAAFEYLLDWLPQETRTKFSPVIVSPSDEIGAHALLGSAWGRDAAIGVFSSADKAAVLAGLRAAGGMFVRPSILAPQLSAAAPTMIGHLLANIDALLMEGPSPAQWRLFGKSGLEGTLNKLGLTRKNNG
jgi:hypothetical protein